MPSSFKTYSPLWPQCALRVSFECVLKEPANIPIGQAFERTPRVLSQFVLNGPTTNLSHSLRVLSKCAHNVAIIYSIIYSKGSLRVCGKIEPMWEFVLKTFKWTHWVCFSQTHGYILKELSMSGSGLWQAHWEQIVKEPWGFFQRAALWVYWQVFSEHIQNLPTEHIVIKVVSKF